MDRILFAIVAGFMIFMPWKVFHAGDSMHRVNGPTGIHQTAGMSVSALSDKDKTNASEDHTAMKIRITANGKITIFELNNSQAARDLYSQLPLSIKVENYGDNEKIFYPPEKLSTADTPQADAKSGTLAYYAPWADVVMFYGSFGSAPGLYALGHAISGGEFIREIAGTVKIEKASAQ